MTRESRLQITVAGFDKLPDGALVGLDVASLILQRSRVSLYRDVNAGKLALVKVGRSSRLRVGELRKIIAG